MDVHELAFRSAPDALFVVDARGRVLNLNARAEAMFGYAAHELLGSPIETLIPERVRDRHVRHRNKYLREPVTREMGAGLDLTARRKDGSEFPVDIMLSPMTPDAGSEGRRATSVLCTVRDVSERRRAEERFRSLLESAPDPMVIVDSIGRIVLVNSQTEVVFGYSREQLLGRLVEMLIPERFRERHALHRSHYFLAPGVRPMGAEQELFGLRQDGTEFPVEISLSPIQTDQGILVSSAIRDLTERKKAQRVLRELHQKEVQLKEIHHRIKNNLAVISSIFYLQSTYTADRSTIRLLRQNQDRVRSIALVHETLYQSDNQVEIDLDTYVEHLCRMVVQTYDPDERSVSLTLELEPLELRLDPAVSCGLVLHELLSNALRHAFPGGRSGNVAVTLRRSAEGCVLTVADDGVGFSAHDSNDETNSLGMRLIRSLTDQLQGELELSSGATGTTARLLVPSVNSHA